MSTYYNEIDPYAAQWLRNLIEAGHIADGVVDERSIVDVRPNDLKEFTQCHFFAGIGVWSYALRNAGWSDDRQVWTGSCPCQPFSAAGEGKGFDDQRHLWPHFYNLIQECDPSVVFGEQVASSDGLTWIDLVQSDMESSQYAFASSDICAASVGAPHIRQRLYFVANRLVDTNLREFDTQPGSLGVTSGKEVIDWEGILVTGQSGRAGRNVRSLADASDDGLQGGLSRWSDSQREMVNGQIGCHSTVIGLAEASYIGLLKRGVSQPSKKWDGVTRDSRTFTGTRPTNPTNGFWRDVDWLGCRDGKFRPVRPDSFPLVDGASSRVGRLRAYGNAINAEQAKVFIDAAMYGLLGLDLI